MEGQECWKGLGNRDELAVLKAIPTPGSEEATAPGFKATQIRPRDGDLWLLEEVRCQSQKLSRKGAGTSRNLILSVLLVLPVDRIALKAREERALMHTMWLGILRLKVRWSMGRGGALGVKPSPTSAGCEAEQLAELRDKHRDAYTPDLTPYRLASRTVASVFLGI